jgi:hypothetical protein
MGKFFLASKLSLLFTKILVIKKEFAHFLKQNWNCIFCNLSVCGSASRIRCLFDPGSGIHRFFSGSPIPDLGSQHHIFDRKNFFSYLKIKLFAIVRYFWLQKMVEMVEQKKNFPLPFWCCCWILDSGF